MVFFILSVHFFMKNLGFKSKIQVISDIIIQK